MNVEEDDRFYKQCALIG